MTYAGSRRSRTEHVAVAGDQSTVSNVFGVVGSLVFDPTREFPSTPQATRTIRLEVMLTVNAPGAVAQVALERTDGLPAIVTNTTLDSGAPAESGVQYLYSAPLVVGPGANDLLDAVGTYNLLLRKSAGGAPDVVTCKKACLTVIYDGPVIP